MTDYEKNPLIIGIDDRIIRAKTEHEKACAHLAELEAAVNDLEVFTAVKQREHASLAYGLSKGDKTAVTRRAQLAGELETAQPDIDRLSAAVTAAKEACANTEAKHEAARADRVKALYYLAEVGYSQSWLAVIDLTKQLHEAHDMTDDAHRARAAFFAAAQKIGLKLSNPDISGSPEKKAATAAELIEKDTAILKELEAG